MAADVATSLKNLSTTEGSNAPAGSTTISTNLDDNLRMMQAVMRQPWARDTIASAGTTDIGSKDAGSLDVTGVTTITALGTVSAGIRKWIRFAGILTLTHNGTSLILPTGANITTAANDVCLMESLGSGNWRCLSYMRASGEPVLLSSTLLPIDKLTHATAANTIANGTYEQTWGWQTTGSGAALTLSNATTGVHAPTTLLVQASTSGSGNLFALRVTGVSGANILTIGKSAVNVTCQQSSGMSITGGTPTVAGDAGGSHTITAGSGLTTGHGGSVNITAGNAPSTGVGGSIVMRAGTTSGGTDGEVYAASSDGASNILRINNAQLAFTGTAKTVFNSKHVFVDNTNGTPAISAGGGGGAAIAGSDFAGQVTFGTGSPTSVTLDFANTFATAPIAVVTGTQSGQILHVVTTTTQLQILSSSAFSSGTKANYIVMGLQ